MHSKTCRTFCCRSNSAENWAGGRLLDEWRRSLAESSGVAFNGWLGLFSTVPGESNVAEVADDVQSGGDATERALARSLPYSNSFGDEPGACDESSRASNGSGCDFAAFARRA